MKCQYVILQSSPKFQNDELRNKLLRNIWAQFWTKQKTRLCRGKSAI